MHRHLALLAATTLALAPLAAMAGDISYSYLDANYVHVDPDGTNTNADGFGLRGSMSITDNVFMFADYSDVGFNIDWADVRQRDYSVGAGFAIPASQNTSFYGKLSYVRAEAALPGPNLSDNGYGLAAGIRTRATDRLELEGAVSYKDYDTFGSDTSVNLAARYFIAPTFAVGVETSLSDNAKVYGVGFRWQWGQ